MLAVIREFDITQIKGGMETQFQILPRKSLPIKWSQFRELFQIFLESEHNQLLVVFELEAIKLNEVSRLEPIKFFDCFDVTAHRNGLFVLLRRSKFFIKLWLPTTPLKSINNVVGSKFLTRIIYTNARAKAISCVAKDISSEKQIRTNWLSSTPAGIIFSRKAASTLIEFNQIDLISTERVLKSVLRSSNLSFGSFL